MLKRNQLGRSMVEMLGVLAIIGVLSIGGIARYRYAMEKHKVNELVNHISLGYVEAKRLYELTDEEESSDLGLAYPTSIKFGGVYARIFVDDLSLNWDKNKIAQLVSMLLEMDNFYYVKFPSNSSYAFDSTVIADKCSGPVPPAGRPRKNCMPSENFDSNGVWAYFKMEEEPSSPWGEMGPTF